MIRKKPETSFIGRESELKTLKGFIDTPSRSYITAIYGRRRIGKTRLVKEAYPKSMTIAFEGLEGAGSAEQKKHFIKTLYSYSGKKEHSMVSSSDWTDLLILLRDYVASLKRPVVVFFDEFQWMAAGRTELVGKLKYVWDNFFLEIGGVHLILCGSISSFLVKKVIRSKALYGRVDKIIQLGPLSFSEVRRGFFKNRSILESLEYYLVMGGVPKYLEMFDGRHSVALNLSNLCFQPNAYFIGEFERLFTSHFGKVIQYRQIVEFLSARKFATRDEIAKHLKAKSGGRISELLENMRLAGFVESYGPVHNPGSTRLRRFRIADPYLRFYFNFIRPLENRITQSNKGVALNHALPDNRYKIFLGFAFENYCYQNATLLASKIGFGIVAYDYGPWFSRKDLVPGAQIDLLFRRADNVITLCEIKHKKNLGMEVIGETEKKIDALRRQTDQTIEKVLVSAYPPSDKVLNEGYFIKILTAEDLVK
jgi:AAA+ ATPase superfamily predicted ATPase